MRCIFRVDASTRMGIGHLMRCLTLADVLRGRGVQTKFICREHPGHLISLLEEKAMPVTVLPAPMANDSIHDENYAVWLGATQVEDAAQTIDAFNGDIPEWLVVDHYGLDVEWELRMRPHVGKIMVIDDLANRHHDCDVLLDQNYSLEADRRYLGLVPDFCMLLVGPRYALLRPEYACFRKNLRTHDGQVKRVLVFFGGSDQLNMTGLILDVLSQPKLLHLDVDVVIGANNHDCELISKQAQKRQRTTISGLRPHLADLMAQADLAIGAGGATTWERMCLGLPALVISIAENQRPGSDALAQVKLIQYAGHCSDITFEHVTKLLQELIGDKERLVELSMQGQLQVDGLGALRIAEVLIPSEVDEIKIRRARAEDVTLYYNWANDSTVRKNAFNANPIPWGVHQHWFTKKMHDVDSYLFVLEVAGLPVGQIRFDKEADEMNIDYSLDVIVRGRGWGARLVNLGINLIKDVTFTRFRAEVKYENKASYFVFSRMNFTEIVGASGNEVIFYRDSAA